MVWLSVAIVVILQQDLRCEQDKMAKVIIKALRQTEYHDLMALYENPIEHTCDMCVGQSWESGHGECPAGFCREAWNTLRPFVEALARGEGNFFDGWMKNPRSALLSCNDGFRPMSFLIEAVEPHETDNNGSVD